MIYMFSKIIFQKKCFFLEKKIRLGLTDEEKEYCYKFLKEKFSNFSHQKTKKCKNSKEFLKKIFGNNYPFLTLQQLRKISKRYYYQKIDINVWTKNTLKTFDNYILYQKC